MSMALPDDENSRRLFLAGLRLMSDGCHEPHLTPECPFSVPLEDGGMGCGEECMDVLAQHEAPRRQEIRHGDFVISPIRPRSRRGPAPNNRPFDAQELYLLDCEKPFAKWRTTTLIYRINALAVPSPEGAFEDDRVGQLAAMTVEMARRGVDVDELIREGLGQDLGFGIGLAVWTAAGAEGEAGSEDSAIFPPAAVETWLAPYRSMLDMTHAPDDPGERESAALGAALAGPFADLVRRWVATADLDSLLAWRYDPDLVPDDEGVESDPGLRIAYRWLVDRSIGTYLSDWRNDSLRCEWQYIHGERVAPCLRAAMDERRIGRDELARTLADRFVEDSERSRHISRALVTPALRYLERGNREAAAALFQAARLNDPSDGEAHNNYGFCVLPDSPNAALDALRRAAACGLSSDGANVANRVYVNALVDRATTALAIAESEWAAVSAAASWAYLWSYRAKDPFPTLEYVRTDEYVASLALQIAEESGDDTTAAVWRQRVRDRTDQADSTVA